MKFHFPRLFPGILLAFLFLSIPSFAQSNRGEIAGSVTDTVGAVIPNAQVAAKNDETGNTTKAVSTSAGTYRFTELPLGHYTVTVTASGFSSTTNTGVLVTVNNVTSLNITLKPGEVSETVTVDASAPTIQTESSDISGTVSTRQIVELPLALGGVGALRSPESFVFLVPGTTGPGTGNNNANGVFYSKLAGGQNYGAEVLLDGASITRSENGSSFDETSPSVEALQEFKVTTSVPSPEFGRTTSGIESFVTKSGTNAFHGTVFELFKNDALDANSWFNNGHRAQCAEGDASCRSTYATPLDKKNDYGVTLGGPVWIPKLYNGKDRTFFFFAWEQYRQTQGGTPIQTVPTDAERGGDFSAILGGPTNVINPCTGEAVLQNQIFDPATSRNVNGTDCRDPFPNNKIDPGRFSASAQALIKGLPSANQPGTPTLYGFTQNFAYKSSFPILNTTQTIRVDQTITQKSKIWASYNVRDNARLTGLDNFPDPFNSGGYPQDFNTHYSRAGWDYAITPNLLNHLNAGYNRTNSKNFARTLGGQNYSQEAGIANVDSTAYPRINWDGLDGFTSLGITNNGDNIDNGVRLNDIVSWQHGRNSFKFGVDYRHQQYSVIQETIPTFSFLRSETDVANISGTPQFESGNSFASFLLGTVDSAGLSVYDHNPRWNSHYIAGFVQDDLKVNSNLTLNIGFRYDVDMPRHEAGNNTSNLSLTAPDPAANNLPGAFIFAKTCNCNTAWADTWYKDFAPRIGFAYTLPGTNNKAVIRGGGAIIYGPLLYGDFGSGMTQGYTVNPSANSANGFSPAFQLDNGFPAYNRGPNLDPGQLTAPQGPGSFVPVGGNFISKDMGRPSMTSNWSLQLQDEVARDLILTVGYIGQTAQNLRSALQNINNIPLSDFAYGDHLNDNIALGSSADGVNAPYPTFTGQVYRALRPFPQYDYIATDCCLQNVGHSSYNAMVVSLERRFHQGLNLQASYTWAKNLTDADTALENNQPGESQDQDIYDHSKEKSVSIQNIPNTFVVSYIYELPFGKGRRWLNQNRVLNYAVGGWQIGGIQRYQSGQPISFGCASGIFGYQNCIRFSKGQAGFTSDAYKKNPLGPNFFNGQSWFNPAYTPGQVALEDAAFVDNNRYFRGSYDPFTLGAGIPRVTQAISSPIWKSEDFSLIKNIPIKEQINFQLKIEALDAFNRHNFSIPDTTPTDGEFGIPTSTDYGPRSLQITGRINF